MIINDADWERVKAAYERGRVMEAQYRRVLKGLTDESLAEDRVRADLERLARCLAKCDEQTLRLLEIQMFWEKGSDLEARGPWFTEGALTGYITSAREQLTPEEKHKGGRPTDYACREAVDVLQAHYTGKKVRGAKVQVGRRGDYYRFSPYVRDLAKHLRRLDPERFKTDNAACVAVWNALKPPARKRRASPSQHQGA